MKTHHGSLVLDHPPTTTTAAGDGNFNLWSSCRRKIINTMRCGGGMSRHRKTIKSPECRTETIKCNGSRKNIKSPESSPEEKITAVEEAVKRLQGGELRGAKEVRELAKADSEARRKLALLGAIPPLVAMLETGDLDSQISALYALLNIGIGNDENKSTIVEAGAVHKMLNLIESSSSLNPDLAAVIIANFLGLSALDSNKSIIGSSGAISFLIKTLKSLIEANTGGTSSQVIHDCLRALYNLSILVTNVSPMVEVEGFVPLLLTMVGGDTEVSNRVLSILTNVVSTPEGRHAISGVHDVFTILVDVLSWMDSPSCQEKATYVLMVMAYKSSGDQEAMIEAGIMSSLLELTLLGSTLAQKRSSRTLEILRDKKGKQISKNSGGATLSALFCGSGDDTESLDSPSVFSSKNAVKLLVEQSLQNNMRKIVKRANLRQEFLSAECYKSSVASFSSSKSLPF